MQQIASIAPIVTQHAEECAFLWSRRRNEIDGALMGEVDIGRIDQRLDANIEGLYASGEAAWKAAAERFFDYAEAGELFVISVLALHSGEPKPISTAFELASTLGEEGVRAISGAIARTERERLRPHLAGWLDSREPLLRCAGVNALRHQRIDAGKRLEGLLLDRNETVRKRAIKHAGAMKRIDLLPQVSESLAAEDKELRLAAATAICLLGEGRLAHPVLGKLARSSPEIAAAAVDIRLLSTPAVEAKKWLQERLDQKVLQPGAVAAIGVFGNRSIMPWLIAKMRDPHTAFAAGLALRDLFEVDFNDTDLFTIDPASLGKDFEHLEDVTLPIADHVERWWDNGKGPENHPLFLSMRRLKLDAIRRSLSSKEILLEDWRRTRPFPAWL